MVNVIMMMRLMNSVLMMTPIAMVATIAINLVSSVSGQPAFIISDTASPDHARPNNSMDSGHNQKYKVIGGAWGGGSWRTWRTWKSWITSTR